MSSPGFRVRLLWLLVYCTSHAGSTQGWRMLLQDAGQLISSNGTRSVSSSRQFLEALNNPSVSLVLINATITLAQGNVDALGGVSIGGMRNVTIAPDPSLNWTTLVDMGNVVGAIVIDNGSALRFENTVVKGIASRYLPTVLTWRDNFNANSGGWPSIIVRPGGTISYINSTLYSLRDDCSLTGRQAILEILNTVYGNMTSLRPNGALETAGYHVKSFPVLNLTGLPFNSSSEQGKQVGVYTLETANTLGICVVDPLRPYDNPENSNTTNTNANAITATSTSSSGAPGWLWVAIFVPVGLLVVILVAYGVAYWRLVRHRGRDDGSGEGGEGGLKGPLQDGDVDELTFFSGEDQPLDVWRSRYGALEGLELGELIGRGGYGRVYKGRWKGVLVAVKIVGHRAAAKRTEGGAARGDPQRESLLSSSMMHPNVVSTYRICHVRVPTGEQVMTTEGPGSGGATSSGGRNNNGSDGERGGGVGGGGGIVAMHGPVIESVEETWMILEYCDRGSLDEAVQTKCFVRKLDGQPNMGAIYRCLIDIAAGMEYLHHLGIVHGDLKSANVLLKSTAQDPRGFHCKIADFGLSRVLDMTESHLYTQTYGTLAYMPPELLSEGKLTQSADVYSFAIIMWELYCASEPFPHSTVGQVFYAVVCDGQRPPIPPQCPGVYAALVRACWAPEPEDRPTFSTVLNELRAQFRLYAMTRDRTTSWSSAATGVVPPDLQPTALHARPVAALADVQDAVVLQPRASEITELGSCMPSFVSTMPSSSMVSNLIGHRSSTADGGPSSDTPPSDLTPTLASPFAAAAETTMSGGPPNHTPIPSPFAAAAAVAADTTHRPAAEVVPVEGPFVEPPPGALLPGEEPVELPSTAGGIKQQAVGVGVEGHMVGRLHSPSMHANRAPSLTTQELLHDAAARLQHTQNTTPPPTAPPQNTHPSPAPASGGISKHSAGYGILKAIMKEMGVSGGTASTGNSPRVFRPLGGGHSKGSRTNGGPAAQQGPEGDPAKQNPVTTTTTATTTTSTDAVNAAQGGPTPTTTSSSSIPNRSTQPHHATPSSLPRSTHPDMVVVGEEVFSRKTVASDRRSGEMVRTGTLSHPPVGHAVNAMPVDGIGHPVDGGDSGIAGGVGHGGVGHGGVDGNHEGRVSTAASVPGTTTVTTAAGSSAGKVEYTLSSSSLEAPGTPNGEAH